MSPFAFLIIFLLILVNAFYVAAEFATVGVRRSRVRQLADQGDPMAQRLYPMLEDPAQLDRYIAACQIGITLTSLVLGAYGHATLAAALGPWLTAHGVTGELAAPSIAASTVLIALTIAQVVLGELVPKSLALQFPTQIALLLVAPMKLSMRLFGWFIALLNGSGIALMRILALPPASHRHVHSPEEIDMLIVESRDGGALELDEQERLHRAIQLSTRTARELMVPRPRLAVLDAAWPPARLRQAIVESPYTRLPVCRGSKDEIMGLLHTKDVVAGDTDAFDLDALMRPLPVIPESLPGDQVLATMRARRTRQLLVLDPFGGVAGLVTMEDLLAEMFGDLADEFMADTPLIERLPDGRVRLPGRLRPDEAAAWVGVCWVGEATTLGGLVMEALGRLPAPGDRLVIQGVDVEVEAMRDRAVEYLIVRPAAGSNEGALGGE